jgi:hypothetical protein
MLYYRHLSGETEKRNKKKAGDQISVSKPEQEGLKSEAVPSPTLHE